MPELRRLIVSARGCLLASLVLSTLGCGAAQPAAEDTPAPQPAGEEPVEAASSDHTDDDGVPQPSEPELSFTVVSGRIVAQAGAVDLGAASAVRLLGALDLCGPVPSPNSDNAYAPGGPSLEQPPVARRALPVAVLVAQHVDGDRQSAEVVLVSLRGTPVRLVSTTVSSRSGDGGGISAEWQIREAVQPGFPLRIQVAGRALPGSGGGMPGPLVVNYEGIAAPVCAAEDPTAAAVAAVSPAP